MSRSNPSEDVKTKNPAARFYDWSGSEGHFTYYDKEAKKKIPVKLPFTFLPICKAVTLKGYNDDSKTSFWSNEVKDISKDIMHLQSVTNVGGNKKIVTEAIGLYKDIKTKIDALGVSYVESLYIGVKGASGLELCNLQIKGAALKPWFDVTSKSNVFELAIKVAGSTDKKKGAVKYKEPIFTVITKVSEEMNKQAVALDLDLQEYLKAYYAKNAEELAGKSSVQEPVKTTAAATNSKPTATSKSEAPFVKGTPKEAQHSENIEIEIENPDIEFGDPNAPEEF